MDLPYRYISRCNCDNTISILALQLDHRHVSGLEAVALLGTNGQQPTVEMNFFADVRITSVIKILFGRVRAGNADNPVSVRRETVFQPLSSRKKPRRVMLPVF